MEFLGLAGPGQTEASSLTRGDVDWTNSRLNIHRHKTDTCLFVPIYDHFRTLLDRLNRARQGKHSPASLVSHVGTRDTPPCSVWTLIELLEPRGWLTPYLHPLLPLAETHQEATGAVFVPGSRFNSAAPYATPALFRQMWPKLLYAMAVEALVEQKHAGKVWTGTVPTKGEVTAWQAADRRRGAAGHTDKINKRVHRRVRSTGAVLCFETLDQEQDGLCVHEKLLANE